MIEPVTSPDKIITDPLVLRELERQSIDCRFVEFIDYNKRGSGISPFMKGYKDLLSGKRIAVASGLPMCNAQGQKIEPTWKWATDRYFAPYNLFNSEVARSQVTLVCLADRPSGAKEGDNVTYIPQLFIGGSLVYPKTDNAQLLEVDPINPNYLYNTLEWDYGVCKRRIRVIQGRFRERWVFSANPKADVKIKHNLSGNLWLKLGSAIDAKGMPLKVLVVGDEEIVKASEFDKVTFPVQIGASATYYPDTNSAGVDGYAQRYSYPDTDTWSEIHDGAGNSATDDADDMSHVIGRYETLNEWYNIRRAIEVIDVSDLPPCVVSATTHSLYGNSKSDPGGWTPDTNIYSSDPASNTSLATGDFIYTKFGTAAYCDTPITYANWLVASPFWNDFVFNADPGIVAVQAAADGDTVLKLAIRNANYDAADTPTAHDETSDEHLVQCHTIEKGTGYKPKLVITYTPAGQPTMKRWGGIPYMEPRGRGVW